MAKKVIGATMMGGSAADMVKRIQDLEAKGITAAWSTGQGDPLTVFAAAAVKTERILLGTCIIPTYPRHPVTAACSAQVINQLAPGRFRLGVGPSHKAPMESTYGFKHDKPLTNLKEYVQITRALLKDGAVDFDGQEYHAHTKLAGGAKEVPVMVSALRRRSFELSGEVADGAISWVCPWNYLREVALPAMKAGAQKAARETPSLVVHVPVCVHDNMAEARAASRESVGFYPRSPFYQAMLIESGYPEAKDATWSDRMLDNVVAMGDEKAVGDALTRILSWGATEILAQPVAAGTDRRGSINRTLALLASLGKSVA